MGSPATRQHVSRRTTSSLSVRGRVARSVSVQHTDPHARIHRLQQVAGNQATTRWLHARPAIERGAGIDFAPGRFAPGTTRQDAPPIGVLQRQRSESPVGPLPDDPPRSDVDCNIDLAARRWRDFLNCCTKAPVGRGCSKHVITAVCKIVGCDKKPKDKPVVCPTGFKPGESKDHKGECCRTGEKSEDPRWCCAPAQVTAEAASPICCPEGTTPDAARKTCVGPPPEPPPDICLPGQRNSKGECCALPTVAKGDTCVIPPPSPPPTPTYSPLEILFQKDKPSATSARDKTPSDSLTAEGLVNLADLVAQLRNNADLKVQLVGRASPEHSESHNIALGQRRAEQIAAALAAEGIDRSRIAHPPVSDLRSECQDVGPGLVTCGEAGSAGAKDRVVLARIFAPNP